MWRPDNKTPRYFEDYIAGMEQELGSISLSEAEMIDFATKYDPQFFHTNPEKALAGPYGGLIASGWHTVAAVMRLLVDQYLDKASSLGSPGIDELRWLAPVHPADVLTVRARVDQTRRSASKPDRGIIYTSVEVINQDSVKVLSMKAVNFVSCSELVTGPQQLYMRWSPGK